MTPAPDRSKMSVADSVKTSSPRSEMIPPVNSVGVQDGGSPSSTTHEGKASLENWILPIGSLPEVLRLSRRSPVMGFLAALCAIILAIEIDSENVTDVLLGRPSIT